MLSSGSRRAYDQIRDDYADDDDGEDDDESMSFDRIVSSSRRRIVEPLQQQNQFDAPWSIASLNDDSGQLGQYVRSELESNAADWARYDTDSSQKNNDMPMSPLMMDSAPIDDLMAALRRSLLQSSCQAQSAEVLRFILQNESCLLLTEDLEYTKARSAYSHFEQNCRLRVGQQQPLKLWREKWIGPWAGMQLCILDDKEQRTLNDLVSLILNTTGAVVDMYLLDECFYVFCVFTQVEDTTMLYGFEGFLFTQSSQSHRGDMARHNYHHQHQQS